MLKQNDRNYLHSKTTCYNVYLFVFISFFHKPHVTLTVFESLIEVFWKNEANAHQYNLLFTPSLNSWKAVSYWHIMCTESTHQFCHKLLTGFPAIICYVLLPLEFNHDTIWDKKWWPQHWYFGETHWKYVKLVLIRMLYKHLHSNLISDGILVFFKQLWMQWGQIVPMCQLF